MVTKAEAQSRHRQERALATGPDADARRRDATLHHRYRVRVARLISSARTDTLDGLPPVDGTADVQTPTTM